ncbi:hypothetical protein Vafri_8173 [Volvox africanus]|nr:hypothetical protein Vafri_8173 [Volvox africanus]
MEAQQLPRDTLGDEGPMFGLTFASSIDASKQRQNQQPQHQEQQEQQQRSLGDRLRDGSLDGLAMEPTCEGRAAWQQHLLHLTRRPRVLPKGQQAKSEVNEVQVTAVALASPSAGGTAQECWHEVWVSSLKDTVTGQEALMLAQTDVTDKVIAERHLALVMETEHRLVEQLFPRHILQYITEDWTAAATTAGIEAAAGRPDIRALGRGGSRSQGSVAAEATGGGASSWPHHPSRQPPTTCRTCGIDDRVYIGGGGSNGSSRWQPPVIRDCTPLATTHSEVTLLFADIKGFTPMCSEVEPRQVCAAVRHRVPS